MRNVFTTVAFMLTVSVGMAQGLESQLSNALTVYARAVAGHDMMAVRGLLPLDFTLEHIDGQALDRASYLKALEYRNDFVRNLRMTAKVANVKQQGESASLTMMLVTQGDLLSEGTKALKYQATETSTVSWRKKGNLWEIVKITVNEIEQRVDGKVVGRVKRPAS